MLPCRSFLTPQNLVFQRSVEPAVDGPLPQAGTELVPRNLPSNPHIPDVIPAKRLEHMLDVLVPQMQQEIANIAARLPLFAMLVLQARVSKRSVEQIAQFEVVLVTPVDRGCLWAAEPRADCGGESDIKNKCRYVLRSRCYMCLCLKDTKENAKVFQHIPIFVAQQRVSERTAKRTLEVCTAVLLIEILTCLCRLRMLRGGSVAPHACASTTRQFLCFHTTERHQRSHCFHLASGGHRDIGSLARPQFTCSPCPKPSFRALWTAWSRPACAP